MKRIGSPCHTPPDVFKCYSNVEYSRAVTPQVGLSVRPGFPVRGYWFPETPPLPVHYRDVVVEPPPIHGQAWYPSPGAQYGYNTPRLLLPPPPPPPSPSPPPPPFYGPCDYNQTLSPHPHYLRTRREIIVAKRPLQATPTFDSSNKGFSTSQKLNPSESPVKHRPSSKLTREESFVTPKQKKRTPSRKNLVDQVQLQIKEENNKYRYNKSNNEVHPEILATWRRNLNKSKESSSTHKVKIEICLKKETTKQSQSTEGRKTVQEESDVKITQCFKKCEKEKCSPQRKQHPNKMSSSNSTDDEKFSDKDGSNSLEVKSARDKTLSVSDDKKSALRFTPSQLHKVHKRKKDTKHTSLLKKCSYTPVLEALEKSRSTDNGTSPTKTYVRGRSSESTRSVTMQESHSSAHKPERDLDSGLDTYRSREEYSPSPTRSSLTKNRTPASSRKSSALKSSNSAYKSDHDSDSDDETQNSSIYVTPEGTPFSMKSRESEERRNNRFKRSLSDEHNDESHSANSSFNNSGYFTPESSPSKFNSAKRPKIRWSDTSAFSQDKSSYSNWRHNTSCTSDQGIQPELIGYQMVGDSQFCRFGQQLLGLERMPMPNCPGRIGICISGQTITDLHRRVKDNFYPISDKIILMIGTNDFLRNVDVSTMCEELSALIKTLQKSASDIILLTLPPIPKLEKKSAAHFKLLDIYNSHIRGLENGETLRIADVSPLYMTSPPYQRCKMHLFEVFFGGPAKRLDLIHLNRLGLEIIRKYILDKFLL